MPTGTLTAVSMKKDGSKLILRGSWDAEKPAFTTIEEANPLFDAGVIAQNGYWPSEGNEAPKAKYQVLNKAAVVTIESTKAGTGWAATVTVDGAPASPQQGGATVAPPAGVPARSTDWPAIKADCMLMDECLVKARESIYEAFEPELGLYHGDEALDMPAGLLAKLIEESVKLAQSTHRALADRNQFIWEEEG